MRICFVYKGRYQIRDVNAIESLSAISISKGYNSCLVYDQDAFGVTDNVFSIAFFNALLSSDEKVVRNIIRERPDIAVFLDGFTRRAWMGRISKALHKFAPGIARIGIFYYRKRSEEDNYDFVITGEPEFAFGAFLKEGGIKQPKGYYGYNGLVNLDEIPLPDKKLFEPYINYKDSYLVYTSKGCLYNCSYCEETVYKNILGRGYYRTRSPERVIEELEKAKATYDIREVIYKGSYLTLDKEWLERFLAFYRVKIGVGFKCFSRAEKFDEETAAMLKESGCYCVEFGAQCFSEELKEEVLNRHEFTQTLLQAFSACEAHRLAYDVDHMFGIPGESVRDHIEASRIYGSLKMLNRIKCHNLVFYNEAEVYKFAPPEVKEKRNGHETDFFSHIAGVADMKETNLNFQKYFKVLPLLPPRVNSYISQGKRWRLFKYLPYPLVIFLMLLLAVKKRDRRFGLYLKYYPRKVFKALAFRMS